MLSKETINDLGQILESEYHQVLEYKDLEKFAYSLVGYYDLLIKADQGGGSEIISAPLLKPKKEEVR